MEKSADESGAFWFNNRLIREQPNGNPKRAQYGSRVSGTAITFPLPYACPARIVVVFGRIVGRQR